MAIYLDYNATTPVREEAIEAMLPLLKSGFGNPSSAHSFGRMAKEAVHGARIRIAHAVCCQPSQVIFTSGGSEANNLFLKGLGSTLKPSALAISSIEHPSIAKPAETLVRSGWTLRRISVDTNGFLDMMDAERALSNSCSMASVMLANNETGAIQDVKTMAGLARSKKVFVHTDAVQAFGKIPIDFSALGVHALSISAHKILGPKGIGALILDKRLALSPLIEGGGQESGLRSGTENVAAIAGFGLAAELAASELSCRMAMLGELREALEQGLVGMGAMLFSKNGPRLSNTAYFSFNGIDGPTLVTEMDKAGFAIASGSACSSGATEPSATLLAMGVDPDLARGAVRVSLGHGNTESQIADFLSALRAVLSRLSGMMQRLQA